MKILDYLFYKIYRLITYLGNDWYPEVKAWFITAMLLWLNFLTVLNSIELWSKKAYTLKIYVVIFYIIYLVCTYIYFLGKKRFRDIIQKFEPQPQIAKKRGTILVGVYMTITIIAHFYLAHLRREMII